MLTICSHQMAAKLTKNLGPPSSTLHVANLPEDLTHVEVKVSLYDLKKCTNFNRAPEKSYRILGSSCKFAKM